MGTHRRFMLAMVTGLCAVGLTAASGMSTNSEKSVATFTWDPPLYSDGLWTNENNWSGPAMRYPGDGVFDDVVIIPGGTLIDPLVDASVIVGEIQIVTSAVGLEFDPAITLTTNRLEVMEDLTLFSTTTPAVLAVVDPDGLFINSGANLMLDTFAHLQLMGYADDEYEHTINGTLWLSADTARLRIDNACTPAEAILDGSGQVIGEYNAAKIEITTGNEDRLVSKISISGALEFTGFGEFANEGEVRANSSPLRIAFGSDLVVTDIAAQVWNAENGGTLEFRKGWNLCGFFTYDSGGGFSFQEATCFVTTGGVLDGVTELDSCGGPFTFTTGSGFSFVYDFSPVECGSCAP